MATTIDLIGGRNNNKLSGWLRWSEDGTLARWMEVMN